MAPRIFQASLDRAVWAVPAKQVSFRYFLRLLIRVAKDSLKGVWPEPNAKVFGVTG